MRATIPGLLAAILALSVSAQETGVLRVTVVLADAGGEAVPLPRVLLLISDNPATSEPRRVRTGSDGGIELQLRPGNYTVETDQPVSLGGRAYAWTQIVDVAAGAETVLALSAENAEITAATPAAANARGTSFDTAAILQKWQRSIVQIWTPTAHATGFLIDSHGFIATSSRAIGDATIVEVQLAQAPGPRTQDPGPKTQDPGPTTQDPLKFPGRVIAADRLQGVTLIWIDPAAAAALPPVPLGCGATAAAVEYEQKIVSLIAPMLEPKDAVPGTVTRVGAEAFQVDWRLTADVAGGPVFAADGVPIGITVADDRQERSDRRTDSYVIPIANACAVLAAAEKKMIGAAPPAATPLRVEAATPRPMLRGAAAAKAPPRQPPLISASSFDIALLSPAMARESVAGWRGDFGNWSDYVSKAPAVLLVRATPQFEESFWKMLARGAAQTQGVALPPMKSFSANFQRMRAWCGAAEVAPIHPFVIERQVANGGAIREGLYVYAPADFGPHCGTVRFDLYSEKSGQKADSLTIDPALFTIVANES